MVGVFTNWSLASPPFTLKLLARVRPRFFIARLGGVAAGCGGIALIDDYAEVKRMYTRPALRGRGVAKAMLLRLEAEARSAGAMV